MRWGGDVSDLKIGRVFEINFASRPKAPNNQATVMEPAAAPPKRMPSPSRTLTGLLCTSRRIEQDAISDECWRANNLPPRPSPERFRFRRQQQQQQQQQREVNDTTAAATTGNGRRKKWDGRIKIRASSWRQKIDRERAQRQSMASSVSTRQLRDVATRRAKLLSLQAQLERECREEMKTKEEEESRVGGEHSGGSGYCGDLEELQGNRGIGGQRQQDISSGQKTSCPSIPTYQREKEDTLVCSPGDNVPYLEFITKTIERENGNGRGDGRDGIHQQQNQDDDERHAHASTSPKKSDHSLPVPLDPECDPIVPSSEPSSTLPRHRSNEIGGTIVDATSSPSMTNDLATKVKELEERLKRLGDRAAKQSDSISVSDNSKSIDISRDGYCDKSDTNDTSSIGSNISKGGDSDDHDLLGGDQSKFGDDTCDDTTPSSVVHRPRPPVLPVPHVNALLHPSHTHSRQSSIGTSGPTGTQETEKSIGFEGIVLGSLIDSIP